MKDSQKPSPARRATLGAVMIALTFLALYGASALPTGRLGAYFLASVFVAGLTCEDMPLTAFLAFIGTSAIAYLLIPNKLALLPYFGFLGWYGVVKYLLERKLRGVALWVIKYVVFNGSAALLALAVRELFGYPVMVALPLWIVVIALEAAFAAYDVLYTMVAQFYARSIRPKVIQNGR